MTPKVGLIQSRGLGDIIIALPIAKYYRDRGYDVHWPIDGRFLPSFAPAVDYVKFLPFAFTPSSQGFLHTPHELLRNAGCEKIITLYSFISGTTISHKAFFNSLKFDEYKYAIAGVPFGEKWNLQLRRDPAREQALAQRLVKQDDYVVVHRRGSNFQVNLTVPPAYRSCQVIEIDEQTDNIFDWLGILERARLLVLVDSCFANLVEQLNFPNEKLYVLRSDIRFTPVLRNAWRYYGDTLAATP